MPPSREKLLLVIPAYFESTRLPRYLRTLIPALAAADWCTTIQIVDDGSGPDERRRLREALSLFPSVSRNVTLAAIEYLPVHRGKGAAIRHGWELLTDETIVAFVDADGSIPAQEVVRAAQWITNQSRKPVVFATRAKDAGRKVNRRPLRDLCGRIFSLFARKRLGISCRDSQCGLKFLPAACYKAIRRDLREDEFGIDLEILAQVTRLGVPLSEFPIDWIEHPQSRVRMFRDGWRMLCAVERLRSRGRGEVPVSAKKLVCVSRSLR